MKAANREKIWNLDHWTIIHYNSTNHFFTQHFEVLKQHNKNIICIYKLKFVIDNLMHRCRKQENEVQMYDFIDTSLFKSFCILKFIHFLDWQLSSCYSFICDFKKFRMVMMTLNTTWQIVGWEKFKNAQNCSCS